MAIIKDGPCPKCREQGKDKTGNHLMIYDSGPLLSQCNRCGYKEERSNMEEIQESSKVTVSQVDRLPFKDLTSRKISANVCRKYGVKVSCSETDGEVEAHYYPMKKDSSTVGYKVRKLPKQFYQMGNTKGTVDLFGQDLFSAGGKKLLITGGECDALAAYQMLKNKYPDFEHPVVSLPKGENLSAVSENLKYINSFNEVIVATDMDEVGQKVATDIIKLVGDKAKLLSISEKDPNDMLLKGKQQEFINSYFSADIYKPKSIVTPSDIMSKILTRPKMGTPYPWPSFNKMTYGIHPGTVTYIGAGVKVGKSEFAKTLQSYLIKELGEKIITINPEEQPPMTCKRLAGKIMGKPYHLPGYEYVDKELEDCVNEHIDGKIIMYDRYSWIDWEVVEEIIRYGVVGHGAKYVFIDPITCFTDGKDPGEADKYLKHAIRSLENMAKDLDFAAFCFCHLNNPTSGKPYEEGGKVRPYAFANSRVMMRACNFMLGIERDIMNEDPEIRNTSTFAVLLNRDYGNCGRFPVVYDSETMEYKEPEVDI